MSLSYCTASGCFYHIVVIQKLQCLCVDIGKAMCFCHFIALHVLEIANFAYLIEVQCTCTCISKNYMYIVTKLVGYFRFQFLNS